MLEAVGGVLADAGSVVRSSHERWDGGGYPDGLARRGDPGRGAHLRRVRRVQRDDDRPALPRARCRVELAVVELRAHAAPSSTPASSTRWSPSSAASRAARVARSGLIVQTSLSPAAAMAEKPDERSHPARDGGDGER